MEEDIQKTFEQIKLYIDIYDLEISKYYRKQTINSYKQRYYIAKECMEEIRKVVNYVDNR